MVDSPNGVPYPTLPFRVDFEVTGYCNLDCIYCSAKPFSNETPSLEKLKFIFEKTKAEVNPFEVLITGGEPFSRPDIVTLLINAKETFGSIAVVTNGTLFPKMPSNEMEELRKSFGDGSLQVSIDSVISNINTQVRSDAVQVLKGLDVLEEKKIPFTVGIVMTKNSVLTIEQTLRTLFKKYKMLLAINLLSLHPSVILAKNYLHLRINKNDLTTVNLAVDRITKDLPYRNVNVKVNKQNLLMSTILEEPQSNVCTAGLLRAGVLCDGSVVPCTMLRTNILGNLFIDSWCEIWKKAIIQHKILEANALIFEQCEYANVAQMEEQGLVSKKYK